MISRFYINDKKPIRSNTTNSGGRRQFCKKESIKILV